MRKKIVAGNWKMNKTPSQAVALCEELKELVKSDSVDVVYCVPAIDIVPVVEAVKGTNVEVGAENMYFEEKGAYTGETSIDMLISAGVEYCIVGHSERRQYFNETDEIVNKKVKKIIEKDLKAILCVGETLEQRNNNEMFKVVEDQLVKDLKDITKEQIKRNIIIAYEPIWAIGTGVTATSMQAQEMCKFIRSTIAKMYNENIAENIRIQYGGSVKASNAKELLSMEDIDGALVGGASLTNDFVAIVNYD